MRPAYSKSGVYWILKTWHTNYILEKEWWNSVIPKLQVVVFTGEAFFSSFYFALSTQEWLSQLFRSLTVRSMLPDSEACNRRRLRPIMHQVRGSLVWSGSALLMKGFGNSSEAAVYPGDQSFRSLVTVSPAYIYHYTATMWLRNGSVRVEALCSLHFGGTFVHLFSQTVQYNSDK